MAGTYGGILEKLGLDGLCLYSILLSVGSRRARFIVKKVRRDLFKQEGELCVEDEPSARYLPSMPLVAL